jgi:tetratricopeptide (TPR) repeat protein
MVTATRADDAPKRVSDPYMTALKYCQIAAKFELIQKYPNAISAYRDAASADPHSDMQSTAESQILRIKEKVAHGKLAPESRLNPRTVTSNLHTIGKLYSSMHRHEEALSAFRKEVKLSSSRANAITWYWMACTYHYHTDESEYPDKYNRAINACNKALWVLDVNPFYYRRQEMKNSMEQKVWHEKWRIYSDLGQEKDAKICFDKEQEFLLKSLIRR